MDIWIMLFIKYNLLTEINKIIDNLQTEMLDWRINSYIITNIRLECNLNKNKCETIIKQVVYAFK